MNSRRTVIILAYIAFIALGMPDGLLGVAWPSIRTDFLLPLDAAGMLLTAMVAGYLVSSFSSGPLISRLGVGVILAFSCALTGIALVGYTFVPAWWMVILLGFAAGLGAGAIDSGLNTYAATHFKEGLMQWLHASYGIGITSGPLIMTFTLTSLGSWRMGYIIVGGFQVVLALTFALMLPVWNQKRSDQTNNENTALTDYKTPITETLKQPGVWLSILLFFIYAGCEFSLGTWVYSFLVEARSIDAGIAGLLVGSYWATFTIGRIVAGIFAKRFNVNDMVLYGLICAILCSLLLWLNPGTFLSLGSVTLIGFAIAPIFPAFMSRTSVRVGLRFSANTIGMQMAAASLGVAIIPGLIGVLARRTTLEIIPLCILILFLVLIGLHLYSLRLNQNFKLEN
ncbi:MAG: MFS transporter [Calditrichae bacterium]|nr:MFS transporter [Calditrichia bacterium]